MNRVFISSKTCRFFGQYRMHTAIDKSKIDLSVNSSNEKANNFKKLSNVYNVLIADLRKLRWVSNACNLHIILKFNSNNPKMIDLLTKINNFNEFNEAMKYFTSNLDKLNVKEQGILFKVLNERQK